MPYHIITPDAHYKKEQAIDDYKLEIDGIDVNLQDNEGYSALMLAASNGHIAGVAYD